MKKLLVKAIECVITVKKIWHETYFKGRKCFECKRKHDKEYNARLDVKIARNEKNKNNTIFKIKRTLNSRIRCCLKQKSERTIKYLDCNYDNYKNWLEFNFNNEFNLDNYGKAWQIDHVVPLSKFDLDKIEEQMIAFNWRNTMPLSVKENLKKNKKIINSQIEQHYQNLKKYNIDLPQEFIDLFAKHLVDGNPSKPSLLLPCGNTLEDLG